MTAEEMWLKSGIAGRYEAWSFGDDADRLAGLVKNGIKTATCSALILYQLENEPLPQAGDYSIILDSIGDAVCIVRTSKVYITAFDSVTEEHAYKEGEGDRSLQYWRKAHEAFFTDELKKANRQFDEKTELVCEEFEVVFRADSGGEKYDSICIKSAETDEELCGRGYVHCTSWKEAYRGIVCDRYLDSMTVEATTARARKFPENTLIAKDQEKVVGFAVYGPSRDEDLPDAGEVIAIYVLSAYYGRKIGYRLMNEAFSRLKEYNTVFVWVLEKNERAIRFYHKYGFEFDGCKKQWNLGTPVSIVRMIRKRK